MIDVGLTEDFKIPSTPTASKVVAVTEEGETNNSNLTDRRTIDDINKKAALEAAAEFYKTQLSMQLSLYENFSAYGESLRQTKQELVESLSQAQQSLKNRDYSSAEKMLKPLPQELEKLAEVLL